LLKQLNIKKPNARHYNTANMTALSRIKPILVKEQVPFNNEINAATLFQSKTYFINHFQVDLI